MSHEDFDVASLAVYLHITPQQVEKLASRGKVPGRKVQGKWVFAFAEIHHWMEERMGLLEHRELQRIESTHEEPASAESTPFTQMLSVDSVAVPLNARTKRSVIEEMVGLAERTGMLWDADRMKEAIWSREELQSTAMANGVALMHPRRPLSNILGEPILALGVSRQGIPFGGGRGLTRVFLLICSTDDRGHLRTLARLTRMFQDDQFVPELELAETADEAKAVFDAVESRLVDM